MSVIDLSKTTVTVSLAALDALRSRVAELEHEVAERRTAEGPPPDVAAALSAAAEVVSFAVGNLHPNDHPRWPADALSRFADECERATLTELAQCYRGFVDKVHTYEDYRVRQAQARVRGERDPPPPGL